jgi:hypothetical protein
VHRLGNVLHELRADIGEFERQLPAHLIVYCAGNTDSAGFGQSLKPRRGIDAIAKKFAPFHQDVSKMHANAQLHPMRRLKGAIGAGGRALNVPRASDGVDDASELGQDAVPSGVDDPAAVARDQLVCGCPSLCRRRMHLGCSCL